MPRHGPRRSVRARRALALCGILALPACGAKYAEVPPRLALQPYGRVAIVTFTSERDDDGLGTLATQGFAEALLQSQSDVELLELSATDSALHNLAPDADPAAMAQALGREKHVPAVFLGELTMTGVKPRGTIALSGGARVKASVSGLLSVRLLSTETGGTMWRSSATARGTVGTLAIDGHLPVVSARDPDEAYGQVVRNLVYEVTRDLRPTWVRQ
ncbi:MAG TPA: hypothetical protein VFW66_02055 [Gemmatimonadales bacterium]|nr:hypothetical protein [Gemmatimonadales bacterium]